MACHYLKNKALATSPISAGDGDYGELESFNLIVNCYHSIPSANCRYRNHLNIPPTVRIIYTFYLFVNNVNLTMAVPRLTIYFRL